MCVRMNCVIVYNNSGINLSPVFVVVVVLMVKVGGDYLSLFPGDI